MSDSSQTQEHCGVYVHDGKVGQSHPFIRVDGASVDGPAYLTVEALVPECIADPQCQRLTFDIGCNSVSVPIDDALEFAEALATFAKQSRHSTAKVATH